MVIDLENETKQIVEQTRTTEVNKLDEVRRHNLVMEMPVVTNAKILELDYKMKLFDSFNKLKDRGVSETRIVAMFPEMETFVP